MKRQGNSRTARWVVLTLALAASVALKLSDRWASSMPAVTPQLVSASTPAAVLILGAANTTVANVEAAREPGNLAYPSETSKPVRLRSVIDETAIDIFGQAPTPVPESAPIPRIIGRPDPPTRHARTALVLLAAAASIPPSNPDAAPAAPAFPYRVIGRYEIDGQPIVFLQSPQGVLAAQIGKTLDSGWRVDAISASALTLTYTPNNQAMTVALAAIR